MINDIAIAKACAVEDAFFCKVLIYSCLCCFLPV